MLACWHAGIWTRACACACELTTRCARSRCCARYGGYWERATTFLQEESEASGEIVFYDSNTGKPLFYGPRDRSWAAFVKESRAHGWPSFRDSEGTHDGWPSNP